MSITLNGDSGITTPSYGGADTAEYLVPVTAFKNRIINGAMVIDQRNAGASVIPVTGNIYTLDRWVNSFTQNSKYSVQRNAGSVTPPVGFSNYLGITSLSAYSVLSSDTFLTGQYIEGFNVSDLAWGTANAATVTLSFQVRSSLTGTFGGAITNGAADRSYLFSYSIAIANTWTTISITIPGDTTGTWLTNNGIGLAVRFGLGSGSTYSGTANTWGAGNLVQPTGTVSVVGTNGATFYITGVQLEKGSTATSFDYRPYGTELALCQRYYYKINPASASKIFGVGWNNLTTQSVAVINLKTTMRIAPTALEQSGTGTDYSINNLNTFTACNAGPTFASATTDSVAVLATVASGLTAGQGSALSSNSVNGYLGWSAEL